MSVARVTDNGIEIEYTDSKSGITVLHKVSEQEGEPVVEDYYKGKDGKFNKDRDEEPAADPAVATDDGETGELKILGFKFKRQK